MKKGKIFYNIYVCVSPHTNAQVGGGRLLELRPFKGLGDYSDPWAGPGEGAVARENTVLMGY